MPEFQTSNRFSSPNKIEERPDYGKLLCGSYISFKDIPPEHVDTPLCYFAMLIDMCTAAQIPKHLWSQELYNIAYEKRLLDIEDIPEDYLSVEIATACSKRNSNLKVFSIDKLISYIADFCGSPISSIRKIVASLLSSGVSIDTLKYILMKRPELLLDFFEYNRVRTTYLMSTSNRDALMLLTGIIEKFEIETTPEEDKLGKELLHYMLKQLLCEVKYVLSESQLAKVLRDKSAYAVSSELGSDTYNAHYKFFDQLRRFDYDPSDIVNTIRKTGC